ncbi:MAG: hypothetical protein QUS14_08170, partial [Pyrinomonadaceae bacterium]|nr:hypothetical protein [Pyrinomonadaceae bacterium]
MKNLFAAMIFGIVLAGVSAAQIAPSRSMATSIAVVEFTPSAAAGAAMSAEVKRQLQASIAFELSHKKKFDVPDVRNTRAASQSTLAAVNGDASTAAVKVGKQM